MRSETKNHEKRTPLTPIDAAELIRCKYRVAVERSIERIFKDKEYLDVGCKLVDPCSWPNAPLSAYILGIKELPESVDSLKHSHIYFAHIFKNQDGANDILNRFKRGKGMIYDLEFLKDVNNNARVTCFSYWAGVAGCAVTLLLWLQKCNNKKLEISEFYNNKNEVRDFIKNELNNNNKPSSLVIGARGRCAKGVIYFLNQVGLDATLWYKKDTDGKDTYPGVLDQDLLFNCVYLTKPLAPFITKEQLNCKRNLSIIADISCDPNGPNNPLPIYDEITTFKNPVHRIIKKPKSLDIMAIDHLPSFLPRESSNDFSSELLPYLKLLLKNGPESPVWSGAANIFKKKLNNIY